MRSNQQFNAGNGPSLAITHCRNTGHDPITPVEFSRSLMPATTTRAKECDHPAALQSDLDRFNVGFAVDHADMIHQEITAVDAGISW